MTIKVKRILNDALALSARERVDRAEKLWDSLDQDAWEKEIERRIDDVAEGRVKTIPLKEAMARLGRTKHGVARKH